MLVQTACQQVRSIKINLINTSFYLHEKKGVLMQCLAGLWWDQQRRSCVLPSEVACNPYNIINSQGQAAVVDNFNNGKLFLKKKFLIKNVVI